MTSRRDLIKAEAMAAMAGAVPSSVTLAEPAPELNKPGTGAFWPDGARMVISVSMQMEGGAQPASVGAAVDLHPALAKEIVQRGHEATGHGSIGCRISVRRGPHAGCWRE